MDDLKNNKERVVIYIDGSNFFKDYISMIFIASF